MWKQGVGWSVMTDVKLVREEGVKESESPCPELGEGNW